MPSYPLIAPTTPKPRNIEVRAGNVVSSFESPTTRQAQIQEHPGKWWEMVVSYPPMKRANAETILCFLMQLHGIVGTFHMGITTTGTQQGNIGGIPRVSSISADRKKLAIKGAASNRINAIKAGDYFTIDNRLYKALETRNSNAYGNIAMLDVWPAIRDGATVNDYIQFGSPYGTWRLTSNISNFSIDSASLYGFSFSAREAQ